MTRLAQAAAEAPCGCSRRRAAASDRQTAASELSLLTARLREPGRRAQALRGKQAGHQLDRRRQDEDLGQKRDDHRQRQQAAEPGGRPVFGEAEHRERAAVDDRGGQRGAALVRGGGRDRLVRRRARAAVSRRYRLMK